MISSPSTPGRDVASLLVDDSSAKRRTNLPIGYGAVRSAGIVDGDRIGGANVGLCRPVKVPDRRRGPKGPQPPQGGDRKDLASEEHQAGCGEAGPVQSAVLGQECQDRGAEYQTLIRLPARKSPSRAGSLPRFSPISTKVEAFRQAAKRSKTERSKWKGAWEAKRSSLPQGPRDCWHQSRNVKAFLCESITPLGWPVEPEVKRTYARSSSARCGQ